MREVLGAVEAVMAAASAEEDAGRAFQQGHAAGRNGQGDHPRRQPGEHPQVY